MKSCGQRHLERGDEAWNPPFSLSLLSLHSDSSRFPPRVPRHRFSSALALAFHVRINCLNVPHKNASKGAGLLICSSKGRWWVVRDHMTYPQCSSREPRSRISALGSQWKQGGGNESKENIDKDFSLSRLDKQDQILPISLIITWSCL